MCNSATVWLVADQSNPRLSETMHQIWIGSFTHSNYVKLWHCLIWSTIDQRLISDCNSMHLNDSTSNSYHLVHLPAQCRCHPRSLPPGRWWRIWVWCLRIPARSMTDVINVHLLSYNKTANITIFHLHKHCSNLEASHWSNSSSCECQRDFDKTVATLKHTTKFQCNKNVESYDRFPIHPPTLIFLCPTYFKLY